MDLSLDFEIAGRFLDRGGAAQNVMAYGARGDGIHDDTSAIQRAVDAGKSVVFPPGHVFRCSTIKLSGGRSLFGYGATLRLLDEQRDRTPVLQIDATEPDNKVFGLEIDGNRDRQPAPSGPESGGRHGVRLEGAQRVLLADMHIHHCHADGIYVLNSEDVLVRNVWSRGNRRQGMSIIALRSGTFRDCVFEGTQGGRPGAGVDIEPNLAEQSNEGLLFQGCTFRHNEGHGLLAYIRNGATAQHIQLINCAAYANGGMQVRIVVPESGGTVQGIDIIGCRLRRGGSRQGLFVGSEHHPGSISQLSVTNNHFADCTLDLRSVPFSRVSGNQLFLTMAGDHPAVDVWGDCHDSSFQANLVHGGQDGLRIRDTCNRLTINANVLNRSTRHGLFVNGRLIDSSLVGNVSSGHGGRGIELASAVHSVIVGNISTANTGAGFRSSRASGPLILSANGSRANDTSDELGGSGIHTAGNLGSLLPEEP
jgi:hypothetical protein